MRGVVNEIGWCDGKGEVARARLQTIADLWDRYSKEVASIENKPSTVREKTRMWERRIKPAIGSLKINEVTEQDVGAVVRTPLRLDASGRAIGGKTEAGNLIPAAPSHVPQGTGLGVFGRRSSATRSRT